MNLISFFLIFSVILVNDSYIYSKRHGQDFKAISFLKVKEEGGGFGVSKLGSDSKIIVDKGIGKNDKSVIGIFGDTFSTQFNGIGLSTKLEKEMNEIFSVECNADVFSFLINLLGKLFVHIKEIECELKILENAYKRCKGYGNIMRRIRKCVQIEEAYKGKRKVGRDSLNRLKIFGEKVSECVAGITKGLWIVGKHVEVSDEINENECNEQKLFEEAYTLTNYKVYHQVTVTAHSLFSVSLSKCKEKRCRKFNKKCRCILSTADQIEDLISYFEKVIIEKSSFISGCTKYLKNVHGSISKNLMQVPTSPSKKGLEEITQVSPLLTELY
ncbi:uncharacterized protein cubi_00976 [Cryptosporidium ubiquitum]|uniref:Uncharacterized protein n=1 Tax=Cryptosporidium ubiquitum TaxID=857276 RepID=A0A1J4MA10_9CRYT|nr:uncharacterized protein cubi_00976 [Cryptosporidium ubiquitum]OII70831.1 hypothetical protein cubi_00976 [Cryptosporidium ubiquitum]